MFASLIQLRATKLLLYLKRTTPYVFKGPTTERTVLIHVILYRQPEKGSNVETVYYPSTYRPAHLP